MPDMIVAVAISANWVVRVIRLANVPINEGN
jgi:hypothetical protein